MATGVLSAPDSSFCAPVAGSYDSIVRFAAPDIAGGFSTSICSMPPMMRILPSGMRVSVGYQRPTVLCGPTPSIVFDRTQVVLSVNSVR